MTEILPGVATNYLSAPDEHPSPVVKFRPSGDGTRAEAFHESHMQVIVNGVEVPRGEWTDIGESMCA